MRKYCRYCAFCIAPDDNYYCDLKEKFVSGVNLVNCKDFALSDLGDAITGKQYKPRQKEWPTDEHGKQLRLVDFL